MAYKVFVSYSTNDFPIVEHVRRLLASQEVEVFIAEYSVSPSQIARGNDKTILPIVLEDGLNLPAFIKDLKYLPAYRNPSESFIWLQQNVFARAQKQQTNAFVLLGLGAVLVWLFSQK